MIWTVVTYIVIRVTPFPSPPSPPSLPPFFSPQLHSPHTKMYIQETKPSQSPHYPPLPPPPPPHSLPPPPSTPTYLCISTVPLFTLAALQQVGLRPSSRGGHLSVTNSILCKLLPQFLHRVTGHFLGGKRVHQVQFNEQHLPYLGYSKSA